MSIKNFNNINYSYSITNIHELHYDIYNEIILIGYSNVGKSTIINTLSNKNISRISKLPGNTKKINIFCNKHLCFLDMPGYGYNKFKKHISYHYFNFLKKYLIHRNSLKGILLLVDIRRLLKEIDIILLKKILFYNKPVLLILNKSDKLSLNNIKKQTFLLKQQIIKLTNINNYYMNILVFSSIKKNNIKILKNTINGWL
ncbi:ribosome biogenesis GTP-binding protein YihA/YsxC [Enterobacteriaceae endosymbiont of Neohaemonia nigricornis]|uniref:ribosome biogenesis GTP-binding protein YihA/YsxC n=1 Tax=Enterobacteriaceae endosymbiont of Neohaemonia nigricornis TaxID=2675792 RepID=UPI001449005C|nr:ribosome biogenesis GTP-binding protein YihA/YsxC [Enterobacteriaceae endosymbiont of Neohaemonia nigricornis]QJC30565.1 ribosome biogenesis GTP-binding protein YsxC [Enterobacteriaceae endosymbiont of Neohaemonia nigricornis]